MNDKRYSSSTAALRPVEERVLQSSATFNPRACRPLKFCIESGPPKPQVGWPAQASKSGPREALRWMLRSAHLLTVAICALGACVAMVSCGRSGIALVSATTRPVSLLQTLPQAAQQTSISAARSLNEEAPDEAALDVSLQQDNPFARDVQSYTDKATDSAQRAVAELKQAESTLRFIHRKFDKGEAQQIDVDTAEHNRDAKIIECQQTRALLAQLMAQK